MDENESSLNLTKHFLDRELPTFDLVAVTSSYEAAEKLRKENFSAIVCDYQLSGINGLELLENLRSQANQIPFIVFARRSREEVAIQALNLGANYFLKKEGEFETLCTELAHIIKTAVVHSSMIGALRESEQKYRELVQELHEGVLAEDAKGFITFVNPRIADLLGYAEEELVGQHWSAIVPPEEANRVMEENVNRSYGISSTYESSLLSKENRIVPVLVGSKPLFTETGEFRGTLSVYTDLTERKRVQQQLARTDKLASLGRISAGVAHELNNPLAFIYMNTETLGKCLAGFAAVYHFYSQIEAAIQEDDLVKAREIIAEMHSVARNLKLLKESDRSTSKALEGLIAVTGRQWQENLEGLERMIKIIENLLSFSRFKDDSKGRLELCQISDILQTSASMLKYQIKDPIKLKIDFLDDLPPVLGDPDRLTQAFLNLLGNAADAIGDNPGIIEVTSSISTENIQIIIRDTGMGIPEEDIPNLFEPFWTTKPPGQGTGLGLSIVHEIIQNHGGQIFVESRLGVGTEVKVTIPFEPVDPKD